MIKKFENFKKKEIDFEEAKKYIFDCFVELNDIGAITYGPQVHYTQKVDNNIRMDLKVKHTKVIYMLTEEQYVKSIENQILINNQILESLDKLKLKYPDVICHVNTYKSDKLTNLLHIGTTMYFYVLIKKKRNEIFKKV
jgi:hypothetical protein